MPIKRSEFLKPVSRDHHHGLLLCWKIRAGFKKNIDILRIKHYTDWFNAEYLYPHFELEETYIFPILGMEDKLVKKAVAEHRRLKRLCEATTDLEKNLSLFEEELESHIRFEERVLFDKIQKCASASQMQLILDRHSDQKFTDNLQDCFWKD